MSVYLHILLIRGVKTLFYLSDNNDCVINIIVIIMLICRLSKGMRDHRPYSHVIDDC